MILDFGFWIEGRAALSRSEIQHVDPGSVMQGRVETSKIQNPKSKIQTRLRLLQLLGRLLPRSRPPGELAATASVLIIRPDHLGDLLLAAPAVGLLRRGLPAARLSYLVGPWAEEVARRGPPVDEVLTCPFPGFTRRPKPSTIQPYRLLLAQAAALRGRFQAALVLRPDHWWGALLAAAAGIPFRLGFAVPECAPFLTHALPFGLEVGGWRLEGAPASNLQPPTSNLQPPTFNLQPSTFNLQPPTFNLQPPTSNLQPPTSNLQRASVALVQRLLALAQAADPGIGPRPEPFGVDEAERAFAAVLLAEAGITPGQLLVAIHPGAGAPLKRWPAERWVEVGRGLAARFGARVLATGSLEERELAGEIAGGIGAAAASVAGRTSLGQLAALFERAQLALGPDSGPLHLAASVGTPTVRLFGPADPDLFMPLGLPGQFALTAPLPCRPCRTLERPPCGAVADPACLAGITVEHVVEAAAGSLAMAGETDG
ncbi:MAG: glycosyltransferase family 9 protein [Chloroflexi bacterium]|nr:glycosyltransferase family 9 protein [Chloroflexota bacterium]